MKMKCITLALTLLLSIVANAATTQLLAEITLIKKADLQASTGEFLSSFILFTNGHTGKILCESSGLFGRRKYLYLILSKQPYQVAMSTSKIRNEYEDYHECQKQKLLLETTLSKGESIIVNQDGIQF